MGGASEVSEASLKPCAAVRMKAATQLEILVFVNLSINIDDKHENLHTLRSWKNTHPTHCRVGKEGKQ